MARTTARTVRPQDNRRREAVLATVRDAGLLAGESTRIAVWVRKPLLEAARARSGMTSDTELIAYALACVVLEDKFGEQFLALNGTVPRELDLEF